MQNPDTSHNKCSAVQLVRFGHYKVERCSCGAVHVAAGPVTLHLDEGAFRQFVQTLTVGIEQLDLLQAPHLRVVADDGASE